MARSYRCVIRTLTAQPRITEPAIARCAHRPITTTPVTSDTIPEVPYKGTLAVTTQSDGLPDFGPYLRTVGLKTSGAIAPPSQQRRSHQ